MIQVFLMKSIFVETGSMLFVLLSVSNQLQKKQISEYNCANNIRHRWFESRCRVSGMWLAWKCFACKSALRRENFAFLEKALSWQERDLGSDAYMGQSHAYIQRLWFSGQNVPLLRPENKRPRLQGCLGGHKRKLNSICVCVWFRTYNWVVSI